ncbi:hypothetical protein [Azospirillum sp. ST 5-10]|uniref:hypothetical protein n=1 Tax=unclassified Azospirillum TaxID=2630922 RepID=UPI003F4A25C3
MTAMWLAPPPRRPAEADGPTAPAPIAPCGTATLLCVEERMLVACAGFAAAWMALRDRRRDGQRFSVSR